MTARRSNPNAAPRSIAGALLATALVAGGCTGAPVLANPPLTFPSPEVTAAPPSPPPDPIPLAFPRDDGPHHRLTEWWYYTGHLRTEAGRRFGFEAVIFRAERSSVPNAWASHLALTDEEGNVFHFAQRSEVGPQVDHSPRDANGNPTGFDLQVGGLSPALITAGAPPVATPWRLSGSDGEDHIEAGLAPAEGAAAGASFALDLGLRDLHGVTQHDRDGFVDFGPAGSSYYYSRMRMAATGRLTLDGEQLSVTGTAWFDHQWGDFISVGGGWDWFAINLDDGTDVTLSVVKDELGAAVLTYGTLVEPNGFVRNMAGNEFDLRARQTWTSPQTGRIYPSAWEISLPGQRGLYLRPTVAAQELDTRATTGVIYWEGSQVVTAAPSSGTRIGEAYVELTRYSN